jgi:aspartyl-tRNA(Asn)/glutamyl-tRNA(Gln) amidotransferase subunit B
MPRFEAVIGLEVHIQLDTCTKIFSPAPVAARGEAPNAAVDPVSLGLPGALPVLNRRVVELAARAGLALGAEVRPWSQLARKNYVYPDLPRGYQISQLTHPLCVGGAVAFELGDVTHRCALIRAHIEEDTAKSIHRLDGTLLDHNRAGAPLLEVVSAPDLRSPAEAGAYLRALHEVLVHVGVTRGNLEEGHFRCDANVSIRPLGEETLGTRTEIKNINSFRFVEAAIEAEIARQVSLVEAGGVIAQQTLLWDSDAGCTRLMRVKERADDYRYFPDPDLPPILLNLAWIEAQRASLPELPAARRARLRQVDGVTPEAARILTAESTRADLFEAALARSPDARALLNLITRALLSLLNARGLVRASDLALTPTQLADIARLTSAGAITHQTAAHLLALCADEGGDVAALIDAHDLRAISDDTSLIALIDQVITAHPDALNRYQSGESKLFGFFMGKVMYALQGKGDPAALQPLLRARLASP